MSEAPKPLETEGWSHKERCLFWARVFSMPYREFRRDGVRIVSYLHPPGEGALLAAEALKQYAEK